jgi:hypothetical protein
MTTGGDGVEGPQQPPEAGEYEENPAQVKPENGFDAQEYPPDEEENNQNQSFSRDREDFKSTIDFPQAPAAQEGGEYGGDSYDDNQNGQTNITSYPIEPAHEDEEV